MQRVWLMVPPDVLQAASVALGSGVSQILLARVALVTHVLRQLSAQVGALLADVRLPRMHMHPHGTRTHSPKSWQDRVSQLLVALAVYLLIGLLSFTIYCT